MIDNQSITHKGFYSMERHCSWYLLLGKHDKRIKKYVHKESKKRVMLSLCRCHDPA